MMQSNALHIFIAALTSSLLIIFIRSVADGGKDRLVDPKSVSLKHYQNFSHISNHGVETYSSDLQRRNCQIIFVLGVEGAVHHGFAPVLEYLAKGQVDPDTGAPYDVVMTSKTLKFGLFGLYGPERIRLGFDETPPIDDPVLVSTVISEICPLDGKKHIIVEDTSFPCGTEGESRKFRVKRQHDWLEMTPEAIADSWSATNHPTNLHAFYEAYRPYADIKFVVLHRPFLETIASHAEWDYSPIIHSNIIRGYMIIIRRFLDSLTLAEKNWHLICVENIFAKTYEMKKNVMEARLIMIFRLAEFLNWPQKKCLYCFKSWRESKKNYTEILGQQNLKVLKEHMKSLEGIWPPFTDYEQCRI